MSEILIGQTRKRESSWRDDLLKRYDKDLKAVWRPESVDEEGNIIPESGRWAICTVDRKGNMYQMYVVKDENGKYRDVSEKDLHIIAQSDRTRNEKCNDILKYIDENNDKIEQDKIRKLREETMEMSKDRWRMFTGTPYITAGTPWK